MKSEPVVKKTRTSLTDYEICGIFISSHLPFIEVASKAGIENEVVFRLGKKLFDDAIASIAPTRIELS